MDKLIPLISDIKQIIHKSDVNLEIGLPMIAVVGSQSTGKSSLLEGIISKQFLPKGKGIVTRRPIQISLCQIKEDQEYAEFVNNKTDKYYDMELFKKEIDMQTEQVCGANKGISNVPLRIKFYSKNVLDLVLVDLPGIIKNPIGDQPKDIEEQVIKMIRHYIKNPSCIIVAVSKATEDSANSESLKLAREVDKEGVRTIGVLTQIDLVDDSVNVLRDYSILSNQLMLGHVCVYLRPPKSTLTISQQYEKESQFFRHHAQYEGMAQKMGVRYLIKLMNMVLIKHIKLELPVIRENIVYLLETKKNKIAQYGAYDEIKDKKAQGILILSLVNKYVKYFVELIEGRSIDLREAIIGGARIQYIFSQIFIKSINKLNPFEFLTDADIRTAIRNANGLRKSLFLPESAFENLLRTQICRIKLPSLECAQLIYEELRRLIYSIRIPEIERYGNLSIRIYEVMEDLLSRSLSNTESMIRNLVEIELGYINTNHPDFINVISLVKDHSETQNHVNREESIDLSFASQVEKQAISGDEKMEVQQSLFKFSKKKNKYQTQKGFSEQSEMMDSKLNNLNSEHSKPKSKNLKNQQERLLEPKQLNLNIENLFNSYSEHDTLPRYRLPYVPNIIKVTENTTLREQTETEMIKRLIVSYFNVVKKNVNDLVPKTIVTMLVQYCKMQCEKILVSNLYIEADFEGLLEEKEYIVGERDRLRKEITTLKESLDLVNAIESKISL